MHHPDHPPFAVPALGLDTPNYQSDVFLELPRTSATLRGLLIWLAPFQGILTGDLLLSYLTTERVLRAEDWIAFLFGVSVGLWSFLFCMKIELAPPRDMPLRFNRARQRLYAYNFNYRWWNPFERWRVEPVAYDWSQVRAERWLKRGATSHGVVIKGGV
ncbi:DUF6708 domain-containing protein, partial [Pseudomonas huaxiensis]|uniref:DUF6708 domain-containing protein n=1 Tax=Pseudomonas huaxiensis TaxID=2213017 RepID=UPI002989BD25